MVQIANGQTSAPNLAKLLGDAAKTKLFHFARFDVAVLSHGLGIDCAPVWCTKIASRLVRTYTDRHGLKDLARELIGVEISKQQQSSDWAAETLTDAQLAYAASDVLYLHALKDKLAERLEREGRTRIAEALQRVDADRCALSASRGVPPRPQFSARPARTPGTLPCVSHALRGVRIPNTRAQPGRTGPETSGP